MDKVSILIPCYNAAPFITEAVDSALQQDYPNKEVIVIDDGSSDDSLKFLQSFGSQIKLVSRSNNGGNYTRNELLHLATGNWIQYLDADDYLDAGKLTEQMEWIGKHPEYDMVYGPVMVVYDKGDHKNYDKQEVIYPQDPWAALVSWELPQTSSPLFRRQALLEIGGWNNEQRVCQEHELYLRFLKAGKLVIGVKEFNHLTHYRQWSTDTISKRKPLNTYLTRVQIMENALSFMKENDLLTEMHRMVFGEWCILVSRGIWPYDPKYANDFFNKHKDIFPIQAIHSNFLSKNYLRIVKAIGFNSTERLASWIRKMKIK